MRRHDFELIGGHLALDFVNTIHDWTVPQPRDYLADFADALRFGTAASMISVFEARRLRMVTSTLELRRLRELRARLERILRAQVAGKAPLAADLSALARDASDAAGATVLRRAAHRLERYLDPEAAGSALLRWRLVEAAIALLTSPELSRLKTCPSCGWFFLDSSKNGSRRWCSMTTCGSNAKARRYYWRNKSRRRAKSEGRT